MKKRLFIVLCVLFTSGLTFGQLSGTYTIPGAPYATIASAIAALNTQGVGAGGVTFNVTPGYTETFGSLTAGLITATGTSANPIVFKKNGSGANPVITGFATAPGTTDYIICLQGTDYITFDAIDVSELTGISFTLKDPLAPLTSKAYKPGLFSARLKLTICC